MLLLIAIIVSTAFGQEAPPSNDFRVGLRGVAEVWSDPAIGTVYGTGGGFMAVAMSRTVWRPLALDVEVSFHRTQAGVDIEELWSDDYAVSPVLAMTPVVAMLEYRKKLGAGQHVYLATGPALVNFSESHGVDDNGVGVTAGSRLAAEIRTGFRVDTGLVRKRLSPSPSVARGLDFEGYIGRRMQRSGVDGFNLNAWRAGVGVAFIL